MSLIFTTMSSTMMVSKCPDLQPSLGGTLTILLSPKHIPASAESRAGTVVPVPERLVGPWGDKLSTRVPNFVPSSLVALII